MVEDGVQNVGDEKDSHRRNPQCPTDRPTDEVSLGPDESGGVGFMQKMREERQFLVWMIA